MYLFFYVYIYIFTYLHIITYVLYYIHKSKKERSVYMAKVAKLKILKPLTIDWDVFGEHVKQMDYNVWKLKNKTITLYHQLVMKELEWNKNNPDNKVNALMRHRWHGYKTLQSYIMHQVREEYENGYK